MRSTSDILKAFPSLSADSDAIAAAIAAGDLDSAWQALQGLRSTLKALQPLYKDQERAERSRRQRIERSPRPISTASKQLGELLAEKDYDTTLLALRLEKMTGIKFPKRRILAWRIEREIVPLQVLKHINYLWELQFGEVPK